MAKEIIEAEIKSNIGEFSKHLDGAAKGAKKLGKETENVGGASKKAVGGVKKLTVGFKALATATGFVFIVTKAFEVFKEVLGKNQKVVDFLSIAMETLSIAFNDLFGFISKNTGKITGFFKAIFEDPIGSIEKLGDMLWDNIVERFYSILEVAGHVGKAFKHLMAGEFGEALNSVKDAGKEMVDVWTGVDDSVDKLTTTVTNAAGAIKDYALSTVDAAKATIELNKAAELAAIQVQGLIEEYDRQAEKLRQTRDDETKTFAERIEANTKLGEVLKEQGVEMQKLVDIQVNAAQVEYDKNQSQENLIALTEALNERKAVEAQITGFQSEQLVNQVALEKELGEVKRELSLESLSGMALELEELKYNYEEKLRLAELAGEDTTAITEKYASDQAAIEKTYRDEELKKEKEAADKKAKWAKMAADAKLDIASSVAGSMVKILGEETEAGKAMAVVQATVDTYKGATAAYSAMAGIPYVGPVLGAAAAGAAIVSGLANVKAILSADESGAVDDKTVDATAKAPAPEMLSGKFELGGGMEPEPLKAFVVTDEMTNSQDQLANIRRRATV